MQAMQESELNTFHISTVVLIAGFVVSMLAYFSGTPPLYYISFAALLLSLILILSAIRSDIEKGSSSLVSTVLVIGLTVVYFSLRMTPADFSLIIGDASDYYWAGVSSALKGDDIGFFLPFTSSVAAIGFKIFGYKYLPIVTVLIYLNALGLLYLLFRELGINRILALAFIFFVQSIPLDIWLSKTTFSEPIWQIFILLLIYYGYLIINQKRPSWRVWFPFYLLIILLPMSRGSAVFIYGWIIFLSLYHFWRFGNFRVVIMITVSMLLLALSIHYTLPIKYRYLIGWQYSRIIPGITIAELMMILYGFIAFFVGSIYVMRWREKSFRALNLPLIFVLSAIALKIVVALFFSMKKSSSFIDLLLLNEFGLAREDLGIMLAIAAIFGGLYIHYRAAMGDRLLLLFVILYALFSIPFTMQGVSISDQHEMLLYWHRYYFSEFFIIHIVSLGVVVKLFYNFLGKYFSNKKVLLLSAVSLLTLLFFYSINLTMLNIVSSEGYLSNSSKIFTWLSDRAKDKKISVVYDEDIRYGSFDAKQLMYRGFYVTGVDVKSYQKVDRDQLNRDLVLEPDVFQSEFLLCLSTSRCDLNEELYTQVDRLSLPLWWRRNTDDIYHSKPVHLNTYAYLYKIKHSFRPEEMIYINSSSDLAPKLLGKGWYSIGSEAVWSGSEAQLIIPIDKLDRSSNYRLDLKFGTYYAAPDKPRAVSFSIQGVLLKQFKVVTINPQEYYIDIPAELLSENEKELTISITIPDAVSPSEVEYSKDLRKLGVSLYFIKLEKSKP
ncbi:MAG: hypothetical protein U9R27_00065 [Campylobacterota bacterium]|nr:hypothetical protein [Campylobacterota bacterium]